MGFDFRPATGKLYFTDNGADSIGGVMTANRPDDRLGYAPRKGEWRGRQEGRKRSRGVGEPQVPVRGSC